MASGCALHVHGVDVGQHGDERGVRLSLDAVAPGRSVVRHRLHQRIPGTTGRAFAQPLGADATTVAAGVVALLFGHGAMLAAGSRRPLLRSGLLILQPTCQTGIFI